ncbi:MAG: AfsR/SARP family transcriptional regulator, partial [Nonomuraea sp.]|nr:AfsR/SARP family transcriptional regulator [Nonomuraea sp.]
EGVVGADYPAVELLADRARAAAPGFALDERNLADAVSICRRLDGMPLAIELAAARLRTMTPRQLADRLDDRFRLLTGGSRTALPRQQTLRAVVGWSWDLLDDEERALLRRMAVFAGGATLESIEEVCGGVPYSLVDKSLVRLSGEGRYSMLETIRAYALERLEESGEGEEYRRRHAVQLMELAERAEPELRTAAQLEWVARLTAERDDWTAALRWAESRGEVEVLLRLTASLTWFWWMCGYHLESMTWGTRAVALVGGQPPEGLVRAFAACRFAHGISQFAELATDKEAIARLWEEVDVLIEQGEREGPIHPLLRISRVVMAAVSGRDEEARALVAEYRAGDDPWLAASSLLLGPPAERDEQVLEQAVTAFRKLGDRWGLSEALMGLAFLRAARGEPAEELIAEAGTLTLDWVSPTERVSTLTQLAMLRIQAGDTDGARADLATARRDVGANTPAFSLIQLGLVEAELDEPDAAIARYEELLGMIDHPPRVPQFVAQVHSGYGRLLARRGDLDRGNEHHLIALDALGPTPDVPVYAVVLCGFALAALAGGDAERAALLFGASTGLDRTVEVLAGMEEARRALGQERFDEVCAAGAALTREEVYAMVGSSR